MDFKIKVKEIMDRKIKNIIFDFGGVLIDLDRERCLDSFRQLGMANAEQMLDVCHQQGFFLQYEKGLIDTAEFRNRIREQIGKQISDEEIDAAWNTLLVAIPSYKLDMLLELRKKYMVYLLSNTNEIHWEWSVKHAFCYKSFSVNDFFEKRFLSYQMKMAKPDVEIFQQVIDLTNIDPLETCFIDDSEANCRTAETLGITTYTPKAHEDWRHLF